MKHLVSILIIVLSLMCASCSHKARGPRPMTHEDSARRAAGIEQDKYLASVSDVQQELLGPMDKGTGTGEVSKGVKFKTNVLDDSMTTVTSSFEKYRAKVQRAQKDSTTIMGVLLSRFKVLDSQHKYLAATYTSKGYLLTFHSEITKDDKHELDYDLYFDKGKLRYIHERRSYTIDDDELDLLADDSYLMSGDTVLYYYRDEGHADQRRDRMNLINQVRYSLRGDIKGHVAHVYDSFLRDYEILRTQPMELMVYTPAVKVIVPEPQPEKKLPVRGAPGQ